MFFKSAQLQSFVSNSSLVGEDVVGMSKEILHAVLFKSADPHNGRSAIKEEVPVDCFLYTEINTGVRHKTLAYNFKGSLFLSRHPIPIRLSLPGMSVHKSILSCPRSRTSLP